MTLAVWTAMKGLRESRGRLGTACCLVFCVFAGACARHPVTRVDVAQLPPLQAAGRVVTVADVPQLAPTPDLLALTAPMQDFVSRYVLVTRHSRQRLFNLHRAVTGAGMLDLQYDPFADGSAADVFRRGSANCLAYSHLFVALARAAGLEANYHWLEVRPEWTRLGERVALRLHVNVLVRPVRGEQYMVDIDPLPSPQVAGSRELSDADAAALHHNNLAMEALGEEDPARAWPQAVRALQLSPGLPPLWVNLGAIYSAAQQDEVAEQSYFRALALDPGNHSAMNNLVILYERQGREDERAYWLARVERYRDANPYYHAWRGDVAGEAGDWDTALAHYRRALNLRPEDSRLLYALGIIQYRRGAYAAATDYIGRAINHATLRGDIEAYRLKLEAVRRESTAAL